jgi:hypothetical protein
LKWVEEVSATQADKSIHSSQPDFRIHDFGNALFIFHKHEAAQLIWRLSTLLAA